MSNLNAPILSISDIPSQFADPSAVIPPPIPSTIARGPEGDFDPLVADICPPRPPADPAFAAAVAAGTPYTVPAAGVLVDTAITIQPGTHLLGDASSGPIWVDGDAGGRFVAPNGITIDGVTVAWVRDQTLNPSSSAEELFRCTGGSVSVTDATFVTCSKPDTAKYTASPPIWQNGPHSWVFRLGATPVAHIFTSVNFSRVTFENKYWYSTGAVFTGGDAPGGSFTDIKIRRHHGGLYVQGDNLTLERIDNFRVSFGNVVVFNPHTGLRATNIRIVMGGNGTSGDGLNVFDQTDAVVEDLSVVGSTCYGVQALRSPGLTLRDAHVANNITSGIYLTECDAARLEYVYAARNRGSQLHFVDCPDLELYHTTIQPYQGVDGELENHWFIAGSTTIAVDVGTAELDDYLAEDVTDKPAFGSNTVPLEVV